MGTRKLIDSSTAFLFEVPGSNSPQVVQELQIGGTRAFFAPIESERRFYFYVWRAFPPRIKSGAGFRWKTP
jgi:hypothetical protein